MTDTLLISLSGLAVCILIVARLSYLKLENKEDLIRNLTEENKNILERKRNRRITTSNLMRRTKINYNRFNN